MDGSVAYLLAATGCLVAVAGVVTAVLAQRRTRRRPTGERVAGDPLRDRDADALRGDPRRLKPGDLVEVRGGVTYAVRGSVRLVEGAWSWTEHLLDDADGVRRWLSVEEDPELELVLWTAEPGTTITPGAQAIDFAGRRYRWNESGRARYTAVGTTGLDPNGTLRYHDYQASGGARLSFEAYGDAGWEVARGERLHRSEVMIYPQGEVA